MGNYAIIKSDSPFPYYKFAKDCTEADRGLDFRCPLCKNPVFLRIGPMRKNHFFGDHIDGVECKLSSKVRVAPEGYVYNLKAMMDYKDRPILFKEPDVGDSDEEPEPGEDTPVEVDTKDEEIIIPGMVHISRIIPLYNHLCALRANDIIDVDRNLAVSDFVVNEKNISTCRESGIAKQVRLVTARRFVPSNIPNAPRKKGYVLLRDAFSRDDKEALYFLVRLPEPSQDEKFRDLLFGNEKAGIAKSPKKRILLLAEWKPISNPAYHVYQADLNSRCYAFVN